jgi:hypothetical protein
MAIAASAWQEARHPLAKALLGSWIGTLEYQDYSSDRRVTLPTKLTVTAAAANVLTFEYTYDEGKGRFVTSSNRITIAPAPPTYRVQSADGSYDTTFAIEGLSSIGDDGGTVVMTGRGRENDRDVELRTVVTITPSALTMRRDSRLPGDEWRFRNQYSLTR